METNVMDRYVKLRKICRAVSRVALGTMDPKALDPAVLHVFVSGGKAASGDITRDRKMSGSASWELLMCAVEEGRIRVGGAFDLDGYLAFLWALRAVQREQRSSPSDVRYLDYLLSWTGEPWPESLAWWFGGLQLPLMLLRSCGDKQWNLPFSISPSTVIYTFQVDPGHLDDLMAFAHPRVFAGALEGIASDSDDHAVLDRLAQESAARRAAGGLPVLLCGAMAPGEGRMELAFLAQYATGPTLIAQWAERLRDRSVLAQIALACCEVFRERILLRDVSRVCVALLTAAAKDQTAPQRARARWEETIEDLVAAAVVTEQFSDALRYQGPQADADVARTTMDYQILEGLKALMQGVLKESGQALGSGITRMVTGYAYGQGCAYGEPGFDEAKAEGASKIQQAIVEALAAQAAMLPK